MQQHPITTGSQHPDPTGLAAVLNHDLALMGLILALSSKPHPCAHASVEETDDGWTCRRCGASLDSPVLP